MLELSTLLQSPGFGVTRDTATRVALLHRSFRRIDRRRGSNRKSFGAHFPPLGLLNLVRAIREDAAAGLVRCPEFRVFDEEEFGDEDDLASAVAEWLADAPRKILAATAYTFTIDQLEAFFARFDPTNTLLLMGGAHATVAPDISQAHVVVRGEGGVALRHILNSIGTPEFGTGREAEGLCFRLEGKLVIGKIVFDKSIEEMPSPAYAYDLLPTNVGGLPAYETNLTRMLGSRPQIYICTQSCRARCTFCSTYLVHGKTKARRAELVRQDLEYLVRECGHDCIEFHDDDLLQHPEFDRILGILGDLGVPWFCFGRVSTIDQDVADRMARAGCRRIFLGVEAMDQATLDYFNKDTNVAQNIQAVAALARAGVGVVSGFIIGAPHHTVDAILNTFDIYLSMPLYGLSCSILSPDPGTAEFRRAVARGEDMLVVLGGDRHAKRVKPDLERFGALQPPGLPTVCDAVSKVELNRLVALIEAEFYHRERLYRGLVLALSASQRERVAAFYEHLRDAFRAHDYSKSHPRLRTRAQRLERELSLPTWRAMVSPTSEAHR
jgi:anaerobic magnesium-protoporphyrin IX monomethyl ester cyclase